MSSMDYAAGLTAAGCRTRQTRLRRELSEAGLAAAWLTEARHVHYLTGYWTRGVYARGVLVLTDGPTILAAPAPSPQPIWAEQTVVFAADRLGTLIDDQAAAMFQAMDVWLRHLEQLGVDRIPPGASLSSTHQQDFQPRLQRLRRSKESDEVDVIRRGIRGCEAAYALAGSLLHTDHPHITELQLHARAHASALEAVGEPIGEFGNDFQSGTPGGPPRDRLVQPGELMPLDLGVVVRGYHSDLCRTFAVGGHPSSAQRQAHHLVLQALDHVERNARPGASCRQLYEDVLAMLDGKHGWSFPHHLGHGIGLGCHESPRLNPHWDDVLQPGDVFTVEPGLYGQDLHGGVRIEQDYLMTESGLERLSHYSTAL